MKIFVTGTAGFIGFHLARRLIADGHVVTGYDGMTVYYDVSLKRQRLAQLTQSSSFVAVEGMLEDKTRFDAAIAKAQQYGKHDVP